MPSGPKNMVLLAVLTLAGCQQKMAGQPSYQPLKASSFFADGRASRPLVAGTVARGHLQTNVALYSGRKTRAKPIPEGQLNPELLRDAGVVILANCGSLSGQHFAWLRIFYKDHEEIIVRAPTSDWWNWDWEALAAIADACRWRGPGRDAKYVL